MTQEEKQLLLIDLCARLPYGVKVCARFNTGNRYTANVTAICEDRDYIQIRQNALHPYTGSSIEDIRPYLRPMSSMTEEERRYLLEELGFDEDLENGELNDFGSYVYRSVNVLLLFDWLNAHHLDYRGLIPMGLALEAPADMYKTE